MLSIWSITEIKYSLFLDFKKGSCLTISFDFVHKSATSRLLVNCHYYSKTEQFT